MLYKLFDFLLEENAQVSTISDYKESNDIEYDYIDKDKTPLVIFTDDDSAALIEFPNRLNTTKLYILNLIIKELEKIKKIVDIKLYR